MKQRIINFILHRILNLVVVEDVIMSDNKGNIYLNNKLVTETELRGLAAEARALEKMSIWKIINESVKNDAMDRGWNKSTSMDDLNAAKTMYYTLDFQNSIIRTLISKDKK